MKKINMKQWARFLRVLAMPILVAGCAAPTSRPTVGSKAAVDAEAAYQRELAIEQAAESRIRLYRIASRLRINAAELCGSNVAPHMGAYVVKPNQTEAGQALKKIYHLDDRVAILEVVPDTPAARAGLQRGDVLLSFADAPISSVADFEAASKNTKIGQDVAVKFVRAGEEKTTTVTLAGACNYSAGVNGSMEYNAFADGKSVVVTQGMMNFAQTDEELALVVSHELAHNLMKHIDAKKTNALGGFFADLALAVATKGAYRDASITKAAAQAYSQEFESEADYVGLYIMARSGYRIDDAPKFWRRMAVAHPGNIKTNHAASHPSTAARMVALESAVAEIKAKQAAKETLVPNMKDASK